jgi:hypothetical protein
MDINKIVERAKNICLTPKTEWPVIAEEQTTVQKLYTDYILWIVGVGFVGSLIGVIFSGIYGLVGGVIGFGLNLAMIFILSLIHSALAPSFGGQKNDLAALKLAAYSFTPAMLMGLLSFIPILGQLLVLAALAYGFYIFYLGCQVLLGVPEDKAVGYVIVCAVIGIVIGFVCNVIVGAVVAAGAVASVGVRGFR